MKEIVRCIIIPIIMSIVCLICILVPVLCLDIEPFFLMTRPMISKSEILKHPNKDYRGYKVGEGIKRLESREQITWLDEYVTVETKKLVPIPKYELKDHGKAKVIVGAHTPTGRSFYRMYISNQQDYERLPAYQKRAYFQYYLVELSDQSYAVAAIDQYYARKVLAGESIMLPIGKLRHLSFDESLNNYVEEVKDKYNIVTDVIIYMGQKPSGILIGGIKFGIGVGLIIVVYSILRKLFPILKDSLI